MKPYEKQFNLWQKKPFIKQLRNKFSQAEIFLVGGAVRDAILDKETQDFDFVVRNVSKVDLQKFLENQSGGKVNLVGRRFGVFKFKPKNWSDPELDIALPRTEHSIQFSGAYKDFKIKSNAKLKIEDDLSRRDFTINSMAWDIFGKKLIDPFDGLKDLKKGIIKTVGEPKSRFKEDYSRMLRAIRFACQLDFDIDKNTWQAVKSGIKNLNKKIDNEWVVAREVISAELVKMVRRNSIKTLELLDKSGAILILLPELLEMKGCPQPKKFHSEGDVWKHTILSIQKLDSKEFKKEFKDEKITDEILWGLIFHDLGKPYTIVRADRLRFTNHDNTSVKKFREISDRLKLSSAGLDVDIVEKIISKHMLPTHAKANVMKDTTIEKYFFNPDFPGTELMMLIFADISATVPPSGKPDFTSYKNLKARITKLQKTNKGKKVLPKQIVTGHDLIKEFKLKSSPKIGKLLAILREAQLKGKIKTKKQGLQFIKKHVK